MPKLRIAGGKPAPRQQKPKGMAGAAAKIKEKYGIGTGNHCPCGAVYIGHREPSPCPLCHQKQERLPV